ncbi:uncharacterized protein BDR25DRAFT_288466 [Lindgomyces ingoldianus]|uniref:Uncharacterized protein n=1 Tax=Lindgomyces ingoldianus TaxID=673940 RepID=A0ACB6QRJ8_9PLEO|nr:uncharacterized protein BDR25DRAFT_288466 [Lindgomyces ingoldianus]KAF2469561.1 hypothetical protein BDR25DRAFT_288466 [Lindgomyces ingoldianus]
MHKPSSSSTIVANTRLIDRLPDAKNPLEMQILILGMPRTGISSLCLSLNILGYKTFHGSMMNLIPSVCPSWQEALTAHYNGGIERHGHRECEKLLRDYNVSCNHPDTCVWEDLVKAYPKAKIILTNSNPDKWMRLAQEPADEGIKWKSLWGWVAPWDPVPRAWWKYHKLQPKFQKTVSPNGKRQTNPGQYESIRKAVPKERLLEFDVKNGWQPLCEFLGKGVPREDFPHVNDREGFTMARTQRWWRAFHSMVSTLLPSLAMCVGGALGWWVARF